MLSFEWLIDPITPDKFFKDYYEREALLIEGRSPEKFSSLLSVAVIDRHLATATPCHPDVFLVDAARELQVEDYAFPSAEPPGRLDLPRVCQLFASGATISLGQMQERVPELAALCRSIEKTFSHHFQTNVYLSPPNAQGFKTHFDSHDVFVLQVSGSKHWSIYDTLVELPLHGQRFEPDQHVPGPVTREFTIKAGDVFYCPRGLFHAARSTDETSLHITLGLMGKTWADVMTEAISQACLSSPAFRNNLPVGFASAGFDGKAAASTFRALLERFAKEAQVEPILERLAESFVASRRPDLQGSLMEADSPPAVTAESRVAPRPDLIFQLRTEGESIVVLFGSTQITLPDFAREAVEAALGSKSPFVVRDLPGDLDDDGKVVLVRRLIKEGMLVRRDAASARRTARAEEALAS